METNHLTQIAAKFNIDASTFSIEKLGQGLINHTWKLTSSSEAYILQQINYGVFKQPEDIEHNINMLTNYIKQLNKDYFFVAPIYWSETKHLYKIEGRNEYYRLFPFVKNSHAKDIVQNAEQAYEAAKQFGKFTTMFANLDISHLKTTIPDFHNLSLRYQQFLTAIKNGNDKRIAHAKELINNLLALDNIVKIFEAIKTNPAFKLRVTHHDTKISNVLFNQNNEAICVIDLDTIMPGYFISDLGDMMRTYLSSANEESTNWNEIEVRMDIYKAIVSGYFDEMSEALTADEKNHIYYSGCFMIYMQALRFLTDYLNDDIYYGRKYEEHNYYRAMNQYYLLKNYMLKVKQ